MNRPIPQGFSPNPGITPMDLAGNPMLAQQYQQQQQRGMLDPRVDEAYRQFKEAGDQRIQRMQEHEPEEPSILRSALSALPMAAMGLFTGGAAIPAALAYATAAGAMDYSGDKQQRKAWELREADEIFNTRKAQLEGAESAYGSAQHRAANNLQAKQGEKNWLVFDPTNGRWTDSGMPIKMNRDQLSSYGKFLQERYGKPLHALTQEQRDKGLIEWQTSKQQRLLEDAADPTSPVNEGKANISAAEKAGEESMAIRYKNLAWVDQAEDLVDDFEIALEHTKEIADLIESGELGEDNPLIGMVTQMFDSSAAYLATEAIAAALQNLQIVNLAPVTEKEFAEIKKMFADIAAGRPANVGRMKSAIGRIERALKVAQRKIARREKRYTLNELRGVSEAAPVGPTGPAGPAEPFDAAAELQLLLNPEGQEQK